MHCNWINFWFKYLFPNFEFQNDLFEGITDTKTWLKATPKTCFRESVSLQPVIFELRKLLFLFVTQRSKVLKVFIVMTLYPR